jgi:hypothetical protein
LLPQALGSALRTALPSSSTMCSTSSPSHTATSAEDRGAIPARLAVLLVLCTTVQAGHVHTSTVLLVLCTTVQAGHVHSSTVLLVLCTTVHAGA